jgi:hypothetical protein
MPRKQIEESANQRASSSSSSSSFVFFFLLLSNGKSAHEQIAKQKQPKKSEIGKSEMDAELEEVSLI